MRRYLSLYGSFLIQQVKVMMEYRVNFLIGVFSTIFVQAAGLLTIWVVMGQIPTLKGWTFDQILLIYGFLALAKSLNHMFADNLWTIGRHYIQPGGFDRFLVRPINPLFHLLADRFCQDGIGNFLVGLVLVAKASGALGIPWTLPNLLYAVMAVISGGVIFMALNLITATASFWIVDSIPVTLSVFQMHQFAQYPLPIYRRGVSVLMTWVIPFGFASFYPASHLMGLDVGTLAWLPPVVAAVLLLIAYRVWLFGLRHYAGTGS
jgi:ABC-2 type transport system permease protein